MMDSLLTSVSHDNPCRIGEVFQLPYVRRIVSGVGISRSGTLMRVIHHHVELWQ